jgi:hypothetical protein
MVNFSEDWPKLKRMKVGCLITTIRAADKYEYWKSREGQYEPLMLIHHRIGAAKIKQVQLRTLDDIGIRIVRRDTRPGWSMEQAIMKFKRFIKGFTRKDNVTLIWLEVTEIDDGNRIITDESECISCVPPPV